MKKQTIVGLAVIFFSSIFYAVMVKNQSGDLILSFTKLAGSTAVFFVIPLILVLITPLRKKVTVIFLFTFALVLAITLAIIAPQQSLIPEGLSEIIRNDRIQGTNSEPLATWVINYQFRVKTIFSNFNHDIENEDILARIQPDSLIDANLAKSSRTAFIQFNARIPQYETSILEEMRLAEIYLSNQRGPEGTQMYYGYQETKDKGIERIKKYFLTQRKIIGEYIKILDLAVESEGQMHIEGDQLVFETQQAASRYNNHINEIQRFSAEANHVLTN